MCNFFEGMSKEQLELADKILHIVSLYIIAAVIVILLVPYFKWRKRKKEIIRKSDENNTFVTARLVKKRWLDHTGKKGKSWDYECIYEYTVNGETKKRRILLHGLPPEEIRLYRKSENSDKFFSDTFHDDMVWLVTPLICIAAFIVWLLLVMLDMQLEYLIK